MKYFGTDGIRVKMDCNLNDTLFVKIGEYFSSLKGKKKILLACDTRISCPYLKSLLLNGLLKNCYVTDLGISSTPSLSYLTKKLDYDFGIMISASHNPPIYNGIKILDKNGLKINTVRQKAIENYIEKNTAYYSSKGSYFYKPELIKIYEEFLIHSFYIDNDLKIAFDLANGATSKIVKDILPFFCLDADVYFSKGTINSSCGATNLKSLKRIVKEKKYDLGVAFDGDGDRIQIIYDNRIIDGDDLLIYFSKKLNKNCVITKITRNDTIEELVKLNKQIKKVDVGDSNIAKYLKDHSSFIGGETSGHIILSRNHLSGDGLYVFLNFLSFIKNKEDLKNAFVEKKYRYKLLSYSKTEIMKKDNYINELKRKYIKITNDKNTSFRFSGTEDVLRVQIEGKTIKEINYKKRVIDSLIY